MTDTNTKCFKTLPIILKKCLAERSRFNALTLNWGVEGGGGGGGGGDGLWVLRQM